MPAMNLPIRRLGPALLLLLPGAVAAQTQRVREEPPSRTYTDVKYDKYEGTVLDFWQAKSDRPTPVVISIHGGGFMGSYKNVEGVGIMKKLLAEGISFVSLEYRRLDEAPLPAAFLDCARAVQFLRSKAAEWNIDKMRIGAFGSSAGAQLAMWVAYHDDFADPRSPDPVVRESSRLQCIAPNAGQINMDQDWWLANLPGFSRDDEFFQLKLAGLNGAEQKALAKFCAPISYVTADDPPTWMTYTMAPGDPVPPDTKKARPWAVHHVAHGVALKARLDALGVECYLQYPGQPTRYPRREEFLLAKLKGR
jgi:acetyl esterase